MKPDWKNAPEWANYLAMDEDGAWYWFKFKPELSEGFWDTEYPFSTKQARIDTTQWKETLEQRPK